MKLFNNLNISTLFSKININKNIYPEKDFRISRIISEEGDTFATFNHSYFEYGKKGHFPWQAKLTIESINQKYLTVEEIKILNFIENSLKSFFEENCIVHYLGRVTKVGFRDIYFYLDHSNFNNPKTKQFLSELNILRNTTLNIKKDEQWAGVSKYITNQVA